MKETIKTHWPFLVLWLALSLFSMRSVGEVPFHPDESTQIFMSSDFSVWLTHPFSLGWDPTRMADARQRYRVIDAPLSRDLIGLGRGLAGLPPTSADWDWSASWIENQIAGALPDERLLILARTAVIALLPLSYLLIYRTGIHIEGKITGFLGTLLVGLNGLTQLHARRAMTEGPLLFGLVFFLWAITDRRPRSWLIGFAMGVVLNAKYSGAAVLPAGIVSAGWYLPGENPTFRKGFGSLIQVTVAFFLLIAVLNPVLWKHTSQAIQWGLGERVALLDSQIQEFEAQRPELVQHTISGRLTAVLAQLYLLPTSFAEAGNYSAATAESERIYLEKPGSQLLRGPVWGTLLLILTVFGLILGTMQTRPPWSGQTRAMLLFLLTTGLIFLVVTFLIHLPFQRYYLPLLPFASLWSAFGLANLIHAFRSRLENGHSALQKP